MPFSPARYIEFVEKVAKLDLEEVAFDEGGMASLLLVLVEEAKEIETECAHGAYNSD